MKTLIALYLVPALSFGAGPATYLLPGEWPEDDIVCIASDPDLNGDGIVDYADLDIFGPLMFTDFPAGDFDNDGDVDFVDLSLFGAVFEGEQE